MAEKCITTHTAKIWIRQDGIYQVEMFANSELHLKDAIENVRAQATLVAGRGNVKLPLLVQMKAIKSMDRDVRVYLGSEEAFENINAAALVMSSGIDRVIGNFLLGLNKTAYPVRLFTSEEAALDWLKGFLK